MKLTSGMLRALCSTAAAAVLACGNAPEAVDESEDELIYGTDDRLQYGQVLGTPYQLWADSTAALINKAKVSCSGGNCALTTTPWTMANGNRLCQNVRYRGEPNPGDCTGFLVGPKLLATAGHCPVLGPPCADTKIVFGFTADASGGSVPTSVPERNVYQCISNTSKYSTTTEDWSLLELDRVVEGRAPLYVRHDGTPAGGLGLAIIGYPMGIPLKVSPTGEVKSTTTGVFYHNVESFGGNSGSPVFDRLTGLIEGIHVTPPTSHWTASTDAMGSCVKETVCPTTGCPGVSPAFSGATRINLMSDKIPLTPALIDVVTG